MDPIKEAMIADDDGRSAKSNNPQFKPTELRALDLLQSSSCYRGDVCGSLPCACAETIAELVREEREQCALIAEQSAVRHNGVKVGTGIAARIRERT